MNYIDCLNVNGTLYDIATKVHPDWCQSDTECYDYICNKPDKVSCFENDLCYARHCELCDVARTAEYSDICNTPVVQTQVIACQCPVSANAVKVCVDSICQCTTALATCINNICTCLDNRITAVCNEMNCLHDQSLEEINLLWQDSTAQSDEIQTLHGCDTRLQDSINCNADCITAIKTCLNGLDNVAFSGLYCDLSGQPTNLSDFTNDCNFIDNTVNNLCNYYTKTCIDEIVASTFKAVVCSTLPATGENNVIYLIPKSGDQPDVYNEYLYVSNSWELIGNTQIDLTPYAMCCDLCSVATSGLYCDLTGQPTCVSQFTNDAAYINKDVNNLTYYYDKTSVDTMFSNLADVANTGLYCDLSGTPDLSVYALSACLCPVATSGSYNCLADKLTAGTGICITNANVICAIGGSGATYYCFTSVCMDNCIRSCSTNDRITIFCFVNSTGSGCQLSGGETTCWLVTMFNKCYGIAYGNYGQTFHISFGTWSYSDNALHLIICECTVQTTVDGWNLQSGDFPISGIATITFDNPTSNNLLLTINEDITNPISTVMLNKNSYTNVTIPVIGGYAYEFNVNCDSLVSIERYTIAQ